MDGLDKQSYGRTNILPMVKWRNCKALCSTVLKQEGLQAWQMSDSPIDRRIGSIGQSSLQSDNFLPMDILF